MSYLRAEHDAEPGEPQDPELPGADGLLRADVAAVVLPVRGSGRRLGRGGIVIRPGALGIFIGQRHGILKTVSLQANVLGL